MPAAAAAATAPVAEAAAPAKPKRRKKLLFLLLGVILLGLLAAGGALYVLKKNTADSDYDLEDGEELVDSAPARPSTPPVFLPLDNMVVNLADPGGNRFVQIGISLQIQDDKTGEEMKVYMPSIRNSVLLLISQRTSDELLQLPGKEKLAKDIVTDISRIMGYRVQDPASANSARAKRDANLPPNPMQAVLFSSFIVQ